MSGLQYSPWSQQRYNNKQIDRIAPSTGLIAFAQFQQLINNHTRIHGLTVTSFSPL